MVVCISPISVPAMIPAYSPRQVFPSPSILFPLQVFPPSIGFPYFLRNPTWDTSTGAEFARYAGNMNHRASIIRQIIGSITFNNGFSNIITIGKNEISIDRV